MSLWKKKQKPKEEKPLINVIISVLFAVLMAFLIQQFIVKPFHIPTESMVPVLSKGQRVLAERIESSRFGDPDVGDIIVFYPPSGAAPNSPSKCASQLSRKQACQEALPGKFDQYYIKRVVGEPGDKLKIIDGHVYRNGEQTEEPFINDIDESRECGICNLPKEITVPKDHYYMMGDNRGFSEDSRVWGPVSREYIVGKAVFTYWPPKRIGIPK